MDACQLSSANVASPAMPRNLHSRNNSAGGKYSAAHLDAAQHACSSKETLDQTAALVDTNGRPIILLKVYKAPIHPARLPVFYEDEEIVGNVELNLIKPETVEEIILSIRGTIKGLTGHPKVFIEVTEQLWNASQVEQDVYSNPRTGDNDRVQLKGYFNWPFCLKLPSYLTAIDLPNGNSTEGQFIGQLPPSLSTPNSHSSITYDMVVSVKGHRSFSLHSPFTYVPTLRPPCIASPRGLACNQALDEDQWEVFRSFVVRGTAFAAYSADISCTLALPKPLSYTRGTSLCCALALESVHENVVELLGNSQAPCVQLSRRVEGSGSGLETKVARLWDAIKQPSTIISCAVWSAADSVDEQCDEVDAAISALKPSLRDDMHTKILIGRIALAPDLTPSFSFAKLSVKYEVQMLPFKAAGFVAEDGDKAIFFQTDIKIASAPPIPSSSRPASQPSSRSNSMRRHPIPPPVPSLPQKLRDSSPCRRSNNSSPRPDFDKSLPPCPITLTHLSPRQCKNGAYIWRPQPRTTSLAQSDSELRSEKAAADLRRAATAPRVSPRTPFPSRQCTR